MNAIEQKQSGNTGCLIVLVSVVVLLLIFFIIGQMKEIHYEKVSEFVGESSNRSYAFYAKVVNFEDIQNHARLQPWSRGSATNVFYFDDREFTPEVLAGAGNIIEEKHKEHCVAAYYRWDSGEEEFIQYPYRNN